MSDEQKSELIKQVIIWFFIISALYLLYLFRHELFEFVKNTPVLSSIYWFISYEISTGTIFGLFILSALGALFFIAIPLEFLFVYYLSLGYSLPLVLLVSLVGDVAGMMANYYIGFFIGKDAVKRLIGKRYESIKNKVDASGPYIILLGNLLIFPIEAAAVIFGSFRYPPFKLMLYTAVGKAIKLVIIYIAYYYIRAAIPFFQAVF